MYSRCFSIYFNKSSGVWWWWEVNRECITYIISAMSGVLSSGDTNNEQTHPIYGGDEISRCDDDKRPERESRMMVFPRGVGVF